MLEEKSFDGAPTLLMGSLSIDTMMELALLYGGMPYRHWAQIFKLALTILEGAMLNDNCGQSY